MDQLTNDDEVTRAFHRRFYDAKAPGGGPLQNSLRFLGVEVVKCPGDLWVYQEILWATRPEVIVECGVHRGGTTLYLATLCDVMGGAVVACDVSLALVHERARSHPRVTLLEGSSTDAGIHAAIAELCRGRRTMVILDSDHRADHVLAELRLYGPLVTPGCYLICEDTNVDAYPILPEFGPGPYAAVQRYLAETPGWKVDRDCERLLLTFHPSGYLLREQAPAEPSPGLASIIVPCFDQLEFTRLCVGALLRHTRSPWELIAIDNGSTDGTAAYLAGLGAVFEDSPGAPPVRVEVIANAENRGFPAAINQGLKAARGEYIVLLNNDAVVTDGWLAMLVALADSDPKIGMAGPMSNYASPPQLVEGVPDEGLAAMHRFATRWRDQHRGQWLEAPKLSGFCLLLKRRVLDAIGGLDERFGLGFFDDDDLSLRARKAGFTLAVACDLFVHHFGSRTFRGAGIDAGGLLDANERLFREKWGDEAPAGRRITLGPANPAGPSAARVRVSLTMIVRDEEDNLPTCLGSAEGLFDEIVVVDTGSKDRTKEIARSRGARVFDFPWVDDFAAARNAALARAIGDYAFWLDADDMLEPPEREKLRALLAALRAGDEAAWVVRCACDPGPDGGGATVVDHVRLFPLREGVRWEYAVHEQILPALRRAKIPVRWSEAVVRHTGYADPALRSRKLARDAAILDAELADRPGDPFVLFNLGSIAVERQDWGGALGHLRASLAGSAPSDSIVRKLFALIARCHQKLGEPQAALTAIVAGRLGEPDDAELVFREASIRHQLGDLAGAEACWRKVLTLRRPERFSSVDAGIYGHLTRRNLASLATARGDRAEADRQWRAVLEECPGDAEAEAALAAPGGIP